MPIPANESSDEKAEPVPERQKVVDCEARGGEQQQTPEERLVLELKAIDQRNQDAELAENEQIPAQVGLHGRLAQRFTRTHGRALLESGAGIVEVGRRSRRYRHWLPR